MTGGTSGDSSQRVSRDIFRLIQVSFTTQGPAPSHPPAAKPPSACPETLIDLPR
jgi:hypothetical protein